MGGVGVVLLSKLGSDRAAHGLNLSPGAEKRSASRVGTVIPFMDETIALRAYGVVVAFKVSGRDRPEALTGSV